MRVGTGQKGRVGPGTEPAARVGLRGLEECVEAGWGFGWGAGRQAQVAENLDDHRGIFNGGNDRQGAAALRTDGEVDVKHAFEQLRPAQAGRWRSLWDVVVRLGGVQGLVRPAGHNLGADGGIGGEHTMETNEMEPRPGDEGGQALQEF